jgi:hypothetical protein
LTKGLIKRAAACIDVDVYNRLSTHNILRKLGPRLAAARKCKTREQVWDVAIGNIGPDTPVLYLEFGVFEGYSLRYFSQRFRHPDSRFFGFDSFEGLPERWGTMEAGTFSTAGRAPTIDDNRVSFVQGWFQDSVPPFLEKLDSMPSVHNKNLTLFIHFDADLYSSTLFLLATLWAKFDRYAFCFDEFMGHELRAVHDFSSAFPVAIDYLAYDIEGGFPTHVFGNQKRDPSRSR